MNVRAKGSKVNNKQLIVFGLLALAVVYHFSRPTLEKWFGRSLPSIVQNDDNDRSDKKDSNFSYDAKLPEAKKAPTTSDSRSTPKASSGQSNMSPGAAARAWLKDIGGNKYQSPAGLIYTGGKSEHRIEHVLRHCVDDQSKFTHGVFVGDSVEVLKMVDEAYGIAKSGSGKVETEKEDWKTIHTVQMGRVIGHTGGKKVKRQGKKELKRLKMVLGENRVITAFPTH